MQQIAEESRHLPDAKILRLLDWIRSHLCPDLPPFGQRHKGPAPAWKNGRVLIFTENREGTKRYLQSIFEQAIQGTDRADERIEVITGLTSGARRNEMQRRFNADPPTIPCASLSPPTRPVKAELSGPLHRPLPLRPALEPRTYEQRNGGIDRELQPAAEVRCHYFVLPQRAEDRVLEVLVRKTETIGGSSAASPR